MLELGPNASGASSLLFTRSSDADAAKKWTYASMILWRWLNEVVGAGSHELLLNSKKMLAAVAAVSAVTGSLV